MSRVGVAGAGRLCRGGLVWVARPFLLEDAVPPSPMYVAVAGAITAFHIPQDLGRRRFFALGGHQERQLRGLLLMGWALSGRRVPEQRAGDYVARR
jgi:hypothetical protein